MKCAVFISMLIYGQLHIEPIHPDMMCYMDTTVFKGMEYIDGIAFKDCKYLDEDKNPIQVDTEIVLKYVYQKSPNMCWKEVDIYDVLD
jgi:hypothetical protein